MFKYLFSKKSLSINANTPPCIIVSSNRLISGRSSREIPRLYGEDSEGTPWLNAPSQRADSRVYMPWRERAHIRVSLYYAAWNAKLRRDLMTPAITQPRVWRICLIELTVYTHDQHSRLRQWRNWLTHRRVNFENSRATVASIPTETLYRGIGGREGEREKDVRIRHWGTFCRIWITKWKEFYRYIKINRWKLKWRQMYATPVKIARRVWLHTQCNFLFNCLGGAPCPILTANKETLNIIGTRDQNCNGRVIKERWGEAGTR